MRRLGAERKSLGVVFDQTGTPTYAADLAAAIVAILPQITPGSREVYHYSNEGVDKLVRLCLCRDGGVKPFLRRAPHRKRRISHPRPCARPTVCSTRERSSAALALPFPTGGTD